MPRPNGDASLTPSNSVHHVSLPLVWFNLEHFLHEANRVAVVTLEESCKRVLLAHPLHNLAAVENP